MSFTGKYELQSQENFEPFMKALGIPDEMIRKIKDNKYTAEIVQDGKKFKVTATIGSKVMRNEFAIGEEFDYELMTGQKIKALFQMEGNNKLVGTMKGMKYINELNGDVMTSVATMGDLTYKRIMKRI
ncbi:fatty acid-binding protein, liver-like [Indicator indicator]|uniref:fatty acid-binding protein, liver-like n=1 Tax=Indicator indicator TaxID=1002788 RepID=UPI0023E0256B|nr:fatty acid-binding protein, liver-like [Indicator indicator]